jgi:hypothetical protein
VCNRIDYFAFEPSSSTYNQDTTVNLVQDAHVSNCFDPLHTQEFLIKFDKQHKEYLKIVAGITCKSKCLAAMQSDLRASIGNDNFPNFMPPKAQAGRTCFNDHFAARSRGT